jgi:hypothetical protein
MAPPPSAFETVPNLIAEYDVHCPGLVDSSNLAWIVPGKAGHKDVNSLTVTVDS